MSLHPLPLPPSLDLKSPASLDFWTAEPPKFTGWQSPMFWSRMPPMTAPQLLALRLGRHPTLVSLWTACLTSERLLDRADRGAMEALSLHGYRGILGRTHRAWVFRFDPARMRRRPAAHHPLAPLIPWVRPDQWLESRFLMAGFPQPMRWAERETAVYEALRRGAEQGYVLDLRQCDLQPHAFRPSRRWCKDFGIAQPRLKESAAEHGVLAVEAALYRADSHGAAARIHAIRSEADLMAESRAGVRLKGQRFAVTPDLEAELTTGQRFWVEVLSKKYADEDLAAKFAGISERVDFVATGRTLARRVERVVPRIACHYF